MTDGGRVIGSSLLGQNWPGPGWFHGRPSASAYIGDVSGGTNLGPGADLAAAVVGRRAALGVGAGALAADALAASASGLDPHISPEYARQQVDRVAAAGVSEPSSGWSATPCRDGPSASSASRGSMSWRAQPGPGRRDRPMRPDAP